MSGGVIRSQMSHYFWSQKMEALQKEMQFMYGQTQVDLKPLKINLTVYTSKNNINLKSIFKKNQI